MNLVLGLFQVSRNMTKKGELLLLSSKTIMWSQHVSKISQCCNCFYLFSRCSSINFICIFLYVAYLQMYQNFHLSHVTFSVFISACLGHYWPKHCQLCFASSVKMPPPWQGTGLYFLVIWQIYLVRTGGPVNFSTLTFREKDFFMSFS